MPGPAVTTRTIRSSGGRPARPGRKRQRTTIAGPLAVVVVIVGVFTAGLGLGQLTGTVDLSAAWTAGSKAPPREFPVMKPSPPIRIAIPAIGVRASVHRVGLADDGTIEVPAANRRNEAGWYEKGPTPGEFGPALIVGHVDNRTGPAVFHDLSTLRAGERVEITRRDRSVAVFEVNTVERFDKARLPVDRVYDDFSRPSLRLITCGGRWVGGQTGYTDNIVVFASLVTARKP
jgi:Sortase domain